MAANRLEQPDDAERESDAGDTSDRAPATTLSVDTWRTSAARLTPSALRTAYSCWRCSPRTSSSAAALPHAMNNTSAAAPKSGSRMRRPSPIHRRHQRLHARRAAFEVAIVLGLPCAENGELRLSLLPVSRQCFKRPTTSHIDCFSRCGLVLRRHPEVDRRVRRCSSAPATPSATAENGRPEA